MYMLSYNLAKMDPGSFSQATDCEDIPDVPLPIVTTMVPYQGDLVQYL